MLSIPISIQFPARSPSAPKSTQGHSADVAPGPNWSQGKRDATRPDLWDLTWKCPGFHEKWLAEMGLTRFKWCWRVFSVFLHGRIWLRQVCRVFSAFLHGRIWWYLSCIVVFLVLCKWICSYDDVKKVSLVHYKSIKIHKSILIYRFKSAIILCQEGAMDWCKASGPATLTLSSGCNTLRLGSQIHDWLMLMNLFISSWIRGVFWKPKKYMSTDFLWLQFWIDFFRN